MHFRWVASAVAALWALGGSSLAQINDPAASVGPSAAVEAPIAPTTIRIPAGTVVEIELTEALSSRTSQQEQLFGLRLAAPIMIDGREVVAAGAPGGGEVIDAHASAFGGRQGRLIISGRYVEINGDRQRIRGMQITAAGEDRGNTALAVSMIPYAGVAGIFVQGGEVDIPVGARGTARLASDVEVPLTVIASAQPAAATEVSEIVEGENQQ